MSYEYRNNQVTPERQEGINKTKNIDELLHLTLEIIDGIVGPVIGICDPISTYRSDGKSGTGDTVSPATLYLKLVTKLDEEGYKNVFNELPLYPQLEKFKSEFFSANANSQTCTLVIEKFFKPLLETKKIKFLIRFPLWDTFYVPYWEEQHASEYGIKIITLPFGWENIPKLGEVLELPLPTLLQTREPMS